MRPFATCLMLVGAAACGGDAGSAGVSGGTFSCSVGFTTSDGGQGPAVVCVEGSGGDAQDYVNNKKKCVDQKSTFADAACTRVNAVGGCRLKQGAVTLTTWYYEAGGDGSDIQQICQSLGVEFVKP